MPTSAAFTSGRNLPIWLATAQQPTFSPLSAHTSAEVCVIGAGIAGMTTAYHLAREGLSVILLEDGFVGSGETGRTSAHLSNALDDRYAEIERIHGEHGARLAAQSHTAAIDRIERIVHDEGIHCDFQRLDGYLILAPEHGRNLLVQEQAAAHRAGLTEVQLLERPVLTSLSRPCLRFPRQAQFHVLYYLNGLVEAFIKQGGQIYTQTHATEIVGGREAHIRTASGMTIQCRAVVVATNTPVNDWITMHTKQAPYRTYVIGSRIPLDSVPPGLYWDTSDPYHYVRLQRLNAEEDVLLIGGEDHKTGQADDRDRARELAHWAGEWFPMFKNVDFSWSGQVIKSIDGLGFIGRNPGDEDNVYIATGDSGMGMTHGTIAGMLLTDLICGRQNAWASLYDPARLPLRAVREFTRENLNMAEQYTKWLKPSEVGSIEDISPGHGAIINKGTSKLAVYRDDDGKAHVRSAVCPHLKCIVGWNPEEQTWDCPCHGSRFDRYGKVLNGPANQDLGDAKHMDKAA